jgi:hypothetical protein
MPDQKPAPKPAKPESVKPDVPNSELTPASESGNPAVQQLLAELATAEQNGATDDAQDIRSYLAGLGFSA